MPRRRRAATKWPSSGSRSAPPTEDTFIPLKQSLQLLDKLAGSDVYTFLAKSARLKVDMSREAIS